MEATTPRKPKPLVNATCKLGKKGCFEDGRCHALGDCENKIVTNADRIRAMSDEELAVFLHMHINCGVCSHFSNCNFNECEDGLLKWLQAPVEEEKCSK